MQTQPPEASTLDCIHRKAFSAADWADNPSEKRFHSIIFIILNYCYVSVIDFTVFHQADDVLCQTHFHQRLSRSGTGDTAHLIAAIGPTSFLKRNSITMQSPI